MLGDYSTKKSPTIYNSTLCSWNRQNSYLFITNGTTYTYNSQPTELNSLKHIKIKQYVRWTIAQDKWGQTKYSRSTKS